MKKSKILLIGIFMMLFGVSSFGQGGGMWHFDWNMGFPMGSESTDFISQPSFRGFSIEGQGFVTNTITVGGYGAWNVFYEDFGWQTEIHDNVSIYGYKRRSLNIVPLMVTGHYFFLQGSIQPYAGIGVGTYYIESRDNLGIYYIQGKAWHFGLAPEVGIVMPVGMGNTGINVGFKYNMAAKTKDEAGYSWLGINIGLSYLF